MSIAESGTQAYNVLWSSHNLQRHIRGQGLLDAAVEEPINVQTESQTLHQKAYRSCTISWREYNQPYLLLRLRSNARD
jgi:hypothetical protein